MRSLIAAAGLCLRKRAGNAGAGRRALMRGGAADLLERERHADHQRAGRSRELEMEASLRRPGPRRSR